MALIGIRMEGFLDGKLDRHVLTEGSYVSVTEHDRVQRPFKIVEATKLA